MQIHSSFVNDCLFKSFLELKVILGAMVNEVVGSRTTEFTLADCPTMDDCSEMNLKSSGRLKQERRTNFIGFFYTVFK